MPDYKFQSSQKFDRHSLVWLRPESHGTVAAQVTDGEIHEHVAAWLAAGRPLVVARQPCLATQIDTFAVGLALPPALGKRRIALGVSVHDIVQHTPPLLLADALTHAPAEWQTALTQLDMAAKSIEVELRVFGSLAWQALSGMQYLSPQSDVDLLWHPQTNQQLQQGIALLTRWEQSSGLRADGEVLFGEGSAVSWREWAKLESGGNRRVLVKRVRSAELVDAGELQDMLA